MRDTDSSCPENPLISVIIPCYNQGEYLRESVQSLQNQTMTAWEAIIVNDGSTDSTAEIAAELSHLDHRLVIVNQNNRGLSGARNTGIRISRGNYLHFLDADDLLHPQAFEWLLNGIEKTAHTLAVMRYQDFETTPVHADVTRTTSPESQPTLLSFIQRNQGAVHTYLVDRKDVITVGGFDETQRSCEDWDLWLRMILSGCSARSVPQTGAYYRRYSGSMSSDPVRMTYGWIQTHIRAWRWLKTGASQHGKARSEPLTEIAIQAEEQQILGTLAQLALRMIWQGEYRSGYDLWLLARREFLKRMMRDRVHVLRKLLQLMPYLVLGKSWKISAQQRDDLLGLITHVKYCINEMPLIPISAGGSLTQ